MAHAARVSMLGELAASIAHEVNQPLGAITANAAAGLRWLSRDIPDLEEVRALTGRIVSDARRAADIIGRIRVMASGAAPEAGPVRINAAVGDAITFLQHELRQAGIRLSHSPSPDDPAVFADRIQLQQVVVNLSLNAIQAMTNRPGGSELVLAINCTVAGDAVQLMVEDTGPGIAADALPRLFDSFFTTRAGGMGMGLAIARSIITSFDGTIRAENRPSGGARFVISLPLHTNGEDTHTKV